MAQNRYAPIRVGIIGTSFISDWAAAAMGKTDSCQLTAVFSREEKTGKAFAASHGGIPIYTDYSAFLNAKDVDAVYVASPNAFHERQTMAALEAGKHVLCEKTMALNKEQAENMVQKARQEGRILLEAIRPLYDPFLALVKDNLERIGCLRRASFEFCQYSSRYARFLAGEHVNIFDASLGNCALLDLGVYCVHCCVALLGMPVRVTAGSSRLKNGTEAAGTALLDYGTFQATISYSKVTASLFPSILQGEAGTLAFDTPNQPSFVRFYPREGSMETLPLPSRDTNMIYELDAFARCIQGWEDPVPYQTQTLKALEVMDAIRKETGISFGKLEEPWKA